MSAAKTWKRGVRCMGCGKRPGAGCVRCEACANEYLKAIACQPVSVAVAARIAKQVTR